MKKIFLILIVCFFTTKISFSQVEFAPIGAKWYYEMGFYTDGWPYRSFYKAESVRDTILLEKSAKVIEFTFYHMFGDTIDWGMEILYGDNEKVYHLDKASNEFYTLFDFTVNVGDTLNIREGPFDGYLWYSESWDYDFFIVEIIRVDTLMVDGQGFKYFATKIIHPGIPDVAIWGIYFHYAQKIGCISSFFGLPDYDIPERPGPIRCYIDDEIYYNYGEVRCDTLEGIENLVISKIKDIITLYPNPFHDFISYSIKKDEIRPNIEIWIRDLFGKIVYYQQLNKNKGTIYLDYLNPGVYHVIIIDKNAKNLLTKKIIKL